MEVASYCRFMMNLWWRSRPGEEKQATALVKDAMEHAVTMAVPLDVSTGIGSDWQLAAH